MSQTPQHFRLSQTQALVMLVLPVYASALSFLVTSAHPWPYEFRHVFEDGYRTLSQVSLDFLFQNSLLVWKAHWICHAASPGSDPVGSAIRGCFHFHCKAWRYDLTGSTVFADGVCTLFYSETPRWRAFDERTIFDVDSSHTRKSGVSL